MNTTEPAPAHVEAYYTEVMARLFAEEEAARARPVHRLSASLVGRCLRQSAYRLAHTPTDERELPAPHRASTMGTAWHEFALPKLARLCGDDADYEEEVVARAAGIELTSRYDLYDPHCPHGPAIVDKKTAGAYTWRRINATGRPSYEHRIQAYLYALGKVQQGHRVHWVVWIYIDRDTGKDRCLAEPFDADSAVEAIERVAAIAKAAANPDAAPREAPGPSQWLPGRSWSPCDGCEWLQRCWGTPPAGVAPQAVLATENDAEEYVTGYYLAQQAEAAAKEDKEFARAVLTGVKPGQYGDLSYTRNKKGAISVKKTGKADAR